MREIGESWYWDQRVREAPNRDDMIFRDPRRDRFWERVRQQIAPWEGLRTLDVCAGFGKFTLDEGIDFSYEMIELAKADGVTGIQMADARTYVPNKRYDVIYEVNSLHSLGWTPEQFYEHYGKHADIVACLECDRFTIFYGR